MINNLQLLQSVGPFDSVSAGANISLGRLTLVYAENGRGKTTLAAIFRSLATGDRVPITERKRFAAQRPLQLVVQCSGGTSAAVFQNDGWSRTLPDLLVFDDEFIDQNVHSGLAVDPHHRRSLHELILGANAVRSNNELETLVQRVETHNQDLRAKADAIPRAERGAYAMDDFCDLQPRENIDDAIRDTERELAASNDQDAIRAHPEFDMLTLPVFDLGPIEQLLQRDLPALEATTLDRIRTHLDGLGQGGEVWVSEGMNRIPQAEVSASSQVCPFCAQALDGSILVEHYRAYFSDAYASLKSSMSTALDAIHHNHGGSAPVEFERAVRVTGERRRFWSRFCEVGEIALDTAEIVGDWEAALAAVVADISSKQAAPLERIALSESTLTLVATFHAHHGTIANVNDHLAEVNEAVEAARNLAATADTAILTDHLAELKAIQARYQPETAALCGDYLQERRAKTCTEHKRDETRAALDEHRCQVFPQYQTAVNRYLSQFNSGFRLDQVISANTKSGSTCTYNVVLDDTQVPIGRRNTGSEEPAFRNALSAGDRNTLALAFFFASLDQDPDLADKVVVIDDPISSLDEHRTMTTVQAIRDLASRTAQVIVLSHRKTFLCQIWKHANDSSRAALEIARGSDGSGLREWNVNEDSRTDHDRRSELFQEYIKSGCGDRQKIAVAVRPHLESFLRVAHPTYYPPGMQLGRFMDKCRNRPDGENPILDSESLAALARLVEFGNKFHHDANPAWDMAEINDQELRGFVSELLEFTTRH